MVFPKLGVLVCGCLEKDSSFWGLCWLPPVCGNCHMGLKHVVPFGGLRVYRFLQCCGSQDLHANDGQDPSPQQNSMS